MITEYRIQYEIGIEYKNIKYTVVNILNKLLSKVLLKLAVIAKIKLVLECSVLHFIDEKLELFLKSRLCVCSQSGGKRWRVKAEGD
jgi:hypothetical protein